MTIASISAELNNSRVYPNYQEMFPGSSSVFTCTSDTPVVWSYNGHSLPENAEPVGESMLYLAEISLNNEGVYECRGSYKDGEVETPFAARARLIVYRKF